MRGRQARDCRRESLGKYLEREPYLRFDGEHDRNGIVDFTTQTARDLRCRVPQSIEALCSLGGRLLKVSDDRLLTALEIAFAEHGKVAHDSRAQGADPSDAFGQLREDLTHWIPATKQLRQRLGD